MRRPHMNRLLLGGLAAALIIGLLVPLMSGEKTGKLQSGLLLPQARALTHWGEALQDETGQTFTLDDFKGKHHLLFFGFAACPDICPSTLLTVSQMYRQLRPETQEQIQVTFISVDPDRDSPEMLRQYVQNFHPDFRALTGPEDSLADLANQAGIAYMKVPLENGYTIDHSAALVLLDREARIQAYFAPPLDPMKLAADLAMLSDSGHR